MIRIRQILLPTDFGRFSQPAVTLAKELVEKFKAHLHLLHVLESRSDHLPDFAMGLDLQPLHQALINRQQEHEVAVLAQLDLLLEPEWKQGKHLTISTKPGKPFVEVVRYANEHEIDLIVMGTHGRAGLAHAMLGSVAEHVVRTAPCPVLTVKSGDHRFNMP